MAEDADLTKEVATRLLLPWRARDCARRLAEAHKGAARGKMKERDKSWPNIMATARQNMKTHMHAHKA